MMIIIIKKKAVEQEMRKAKGKLSKCRLGIML